MSTFWSNIVAVVILLNIVGCYLLIRWVAKPTKGESNHGEPTGHKWDGDLEELNNPMPRWWLMMFYMSIIFALVYLSFYGGFSDNKGLGNWSSAQEYQDEVALAEKNYGPIFSKFAATPIEELAKDEDGKRAGQRLFVTYCAQCHGSDAGGARGFPNLTDNDWNWGGSAAEIEQTILHGRTGVMAAWGATLKPDQLNHVVEYVLSLSGRKHIATDAERGSKVFATFCAACHTAEGTGNKLFGAPNLTDNIWLHGASKSSIIKTITDGRMGQMPAHKEFLGEDKVHLLAAYIYGLRDNK